MLLLCCIYKVSSYIQNVWFDPLQHQLLSAVPLFDTRLHPSDHPTLELALNETTCEHGVEIWSGCSQHIPMTVSNVTIQLYISSHANL